MNGNAAVLLPGAMDPLLHVGRFERGGLSDVEVETMNHSKLDCLLEVMMTVAMSAVAAMMVVLLSDLTWMFFHR